MRPRKHAKYMHLPVIAEIPDLIKPTPTTQHKLDRSSADFSKNVDRPEFKHYSNNYTEVDVVLEG